MGDAQPDPPREGSPETIRCDVSESFPEWLRAAGGSIALTTYQAGKVGMIGWDGRRVTLLFRDFPKPMGLDVDGPRMLLATQHRLIELGNDPLLAVEFLEGQPGRYDALYLPRVAHYTGDLNVHDVADGIDGPWMVNTRFSCLSVAGRDYSFVARWRPPFLSELVPEDRCHLNGLAMQGGRPRFVTALGETDAVGGWRAGKDGGGVLIDVEANQVVLRGLSMPHSPRFHEGGLYVLNSGAGELWRVELDSFRHQVVCNLPGYARGLGFAGHYALVGLSMIREKHVFGGLPVQTRHPALKCGVAVVERPRRPAGRPVRVHRRLHRDLRRAVPAGRPPAHDPQRREGCLPPGGHRARVLVLASPERRRDRSGVRIRGLVEILQRGYANSVVLDCFSKFDEVNCARSINIRGAIRNRRRSIFCEPGLLVDASGWITGRIRDGTASPLRAGRRSSAAPTSAQGCSA